MMTYARTIGDRVLKLRKEKNLTQEQLGKLTSIQRTTINAIETNDKMPTVDQVIRLASYFQVSADWILCLTEIRDYTAIKEKWNKDVYKYIVEFKRDVIAHINAQLEGGEKNG